MRDYPLAKVYQTIEPGPVVLLTTAAKGRANVMTMSWHMMVDFEPPLIACIVSEGDYSFAALTRVPAAHVAAPLIAECFINLECTVIDTRLVNAYGLFILEVVKAWTDPKQKNAKTIHHRGYGKFAGTATSSS